MYLLHDIERSCVILSMDCIEGMALACERPRAAARDEYDM